MLQEPCDTKGGKREGGEQCGTEQETWSQVGDWARGGGLPPGGCVNSPPPAGGAPPATAVVASAAAAGVVQAPAAYTQVVEPYSQVGAAKAKVGREGGGKAMRDGARDGARVLANTISVYLLVSE